MGIYIFNWKRLREVLVNGYSKGNPMEDFGGDVIPAYIEAEKMCLLTALRDIGKTLGPLILFINPVWNFLI